MGGVSGARYTFSGGLSGIPILAVSDARLRTLPLFVWLGDNSVVS